MTEDAEARFRTVFTHLPAVTAYARRRGSRDPDALAAEVMTIAWRRLCDVPGDDALPWLYATARNLLLAERRRPPTSSDVPERAAPEPDGWSLDPAVDAALRSLSHADREALLLVAWEDLTPTQAARSLGITAPAFRVRLLRARRRLRDRMSDVPMPHAQLDVEGT